MMVDLSRVTGRIQAMLNGVVASIPNIILALIVLIVFLALGRAAQNFVLRAGRRYRNSFNVGLIIGRLVYWAVGLAGVLAAISVVAPSFQAKDLINMLGIGGLAIGFAFRDIFQNFLAGIILLLTHPFAIGDQISAGGFEGTVEAIETRATTIRTFDGRRVVIPNSTLFAEPLSVNTAFGQRQSEYEVHLKGGQDLERARNRVRDALRNVPEVLSDPAPEVLLSGVADDNVTLLARWWTSPENTEALKVRDRVLFAIHRTLSSMTPGAAAVR
jgi:small conductance mechanosensitive channel